MRRLRIATGALAIASAAMAGTIPAGYTCVGNCGTGTSNGTVTAPPGGTTYLYVSTENGTDGGGNLPTGALGGETNGSRLSSPVFHADAGDTLAFRFNYVTSDGTETFPDYGWAALLNSNGGSAAILFSARTVPSPGNIVPGNGMPAPAATLTPGLVPIQNGTDWAELGGSSGQCYMGEGNGCGNSGWILSTYAIPSSGDYRLAFGVSNFGDTAFDSGLAIAGATVGGVPIDGAATPEPSMFGLLGLGATGVVAFARRR